MTSPLMIAMALALLGSAVSAAEPSHRTATESAVPIMAQSEQSGIEGHVYIGPARSVERKGVSNQRPYQAQITVLDLAGQKLAVVESDAEGKFRINLPPGTYVVRPESAGLYPRASEQRVTVGPNSMTRIEIGYDSGKR